MSNRIGTDTAAAIVQTDTLQLIDKADSIVRSCTGTNCNTSLVTQTAIKQELSILAQQQAEQTQRFLSIPENSVIGRTVYEDYLNLGAAVAAVYNYQCGANTVISQTCVTSSTTVQNAQNILEMTLLQPAQTEGSHIVISALLFSVILVCAFLFFIFLLIGLISTL